MAATPVTRLSSNKTLAMARTRAADPVAIAPVITAGNPHEVWGSVKKGKKAALVHRSKDQNSAHSFALRWFSDRLTERATHVTVEVRHQPAGALPLQISAVMAYVRE